MIDVPKFGQEFLAEVDRFLSEHWSRLACRQVSDAYFDFFHSLKRYRGNASGFTGFSEFLIFRILYHMLGGKFDEKKHTSDTNRFESRKNQGLWIGQNLRLDMDNKRYYPDIVIFDHNDLIGMIQVKIYLTNGHRELEREIEHLQEIKMKHRTMRALLLIFGDLAKGGIIRPKLEKNKREIDWFDYVGLREVDEPLCAVLDRTLALGRMNQRV